MHSITIFLSFFLISLFLSFFRSFFLCVALQTIEPRIVNALQIRIKNIHVHIVDDNIHHTPFAFEVRRGGRRRLLHSHFTLDGVERLISSVSR